MVLGDASLSFTFHCNFNISRPPGGDHPGLAESNALSEGSNLKVAGGAGAHK